MTPESVSEGSVSPVESPAGSEQRPDHTGVIRPADGAETRSMLRHALDTLADRDATIERMARDRVECIANLDDAEARVERLWAQLNEATNTPHSDPGDPGECCASGRCEVCCPGYVWGRDG